MNILSPYLQIELLSEICTPLLRSTSPQTLLILLDRLQVVRDLLTLRSDLLGLGSLLIEVATSAENHASAQWLDNDSFTTNNDMKTDDLLLPHCLHCPQMDGMIYPY